MLSPAQRRLLKMAQREAHLPDAEYREELQRLAGVDSSTAATWTDEQFDCVMAYFEAIHSNKVRQGLIEPSYSPRSVFRQAGYWAAKNSRGNTSRDRYTASQLGEMIQNTEIKLAGQISGNATNYLARVRETVVGNRVGIAAERDYLAALQRTLASKLRTRDHARRTTPAHPHPGPSPRRGG